MSEKNVEVARRALKAFNRRDFDMLVELITPDIEWYPAMPGAVKDGYRGRLGVEEYLREVHDTWKDYRARSMVFRDIHDGVLVLGRAEGHGRDNAVKVDSPLGMVMDFRDGRISRVRSFLDHSEASHAAGASRLLHRTGNGRSLRHSLHIGHGDAAAHHAVSNTGLEAEGDG